MSTHLQPMDTMQARARRGIQISLRNVTKDYGLAQPAVTDVSLQIEPGEFLTLLGPSGSGKTTTLNLIAGFETPTSGSVHFDGMDVSTLPPHKRNLGMLFQNYALFPHMTVTRNVGYPLRERRMSKAVIARKVKEVLDLVQLQGRDDAYPSELSGGQQQRVALARAIVFEPRALLLDEPLSALDRRLRATLQVEMRRIHRELGATFIFVTHDQEEAMSMSDRIALFNEGRIEQVGSPETLYARPDTLFAARFLGDSNVFDLAVGPIGPIASWRDETWEIVPETVSPCTANSTRTALVVRPENVSLAASRSSVPTGANAVNAVVCDIEYMGAYRSIILEFDEGRLEGRARVTSSTLTVAVGQRMIAWWWPREQRIVAV